MRLDAAMLGHGPLFEDDEDLRILLAILGDALERSDASMLACCLMGNHYHFVLHTRREIW